MTRAENIAILKEQYANAMNKRQLKKAAQVYAKLSSLRLRQLNAENRMDRKAS